MSRVIEYWHLMTSPCMAVPRGWAPFAGMRMNHGRPVAAESALCDNRRVTARREMMNSTDDSTGNEALAKLIARIVQRDRAALAELYDASASRAYALALRIAGDQPNAEEVVSDTYYQIWTQAERYDAQRGRVLAWIMTICRSRALDNLRRRDVAEQHPDPDLLRNDLASEEGPLDLLLSIERSSAVHCALAALDARDRLLLSLAFFKGLSHQEIAEQTDMPLGTVKSIIRRSMVSLRSMLERAEISVKELS